MYQLNQRAVGIAKGHGSVTHDPKSRVILGLDFGSKNLTLTQEVKGSTTYYHFLGHALHGAVILTPKPQVQGNTIVLPGG